MKLNPAITASLLVVGFGLVTMANAADEPTVDSVLAKYVNASGGKAAIEKVSSRLTRIKIESEAFGTSEGQVCAMAPNKLATHIDLPNAGTMDDGFDGTVAWSKSSWQGIRQKTNEELAKAKRDADFYRVLNFKANYPGLAFAGTDKVGDEEANVLEYKPSKTTSEKFWFSVKTGLLIRQDSQFGGPQGEVTTSALAQDYKAVDGIKYPGTLKMKFSAGGQSFEMTMKFLEIQHNVKLEPARFAKPAA